MITFNIVSQTETNIHVGMQGEDLTPSYASLKIFDELKEYQNVTLTLCKDLTLTSLVIGKMIMLTKFSKVSLIIKGDSHVMSIIKAMGLQNTFNITEQA